MWRHHKFTFQAKPDGWCSIIEIFHLFELEKVSSFISVTLLSIYIPFKLQIERIHLFAFLLQNEEFSAILLYSWDSILISLNLNLHGHLVFFLYFSQWRKKIRTWILSTKAISNESNWNLIRNLFFNTFATSKTLIKKIFL